MTIISLLYITPLKLVISSLVLGYYQSLLFFSCCSGLIPHPTTIGYWTIGRAGMFAPGGGMYVKGFLGERRIDLEGGESIKAITLGFTGLNIFLTFAIGFSPFIVYKYHEKQ